MKVKALLTILLATFFSSACNNVSQPVSLKNPPAQTLSEPGLSSYFRWELDFCFNLFDQNKNNQLTLQEILDRINDPDSTPESITQSFKEHDQNHDQNLNRKEYENFAKTNKLLTNPDKLRELYRQIFNFIDKNQDQQLSLNEFTEDLKNLENEADRIVRKGLFYAIDLEYNKSLSFSEFEDLTFAYTKWYWAEIDLKHEKNRNRYVIVPPLLY